MFFWKKRDKGGFDMNGKEAVIKASICNGEQVAGFLDRESQVFEDVMLIRDEKDLKEFRARYGVEGKIRKIY